MPQPSLERSDCTVAAAPAKGCRLNFGIGSLGIADMAAERSTFLATQLA